MRAYFLWLAKLLTVLVLFFGFFVFLLGGVGALIVGDDLGLGDKKTKPVAVIEVSGIIENSKDALKDLYRYAQDDSVLGIVLRVDSPGGAVSPSQEIYQAIKVLREKKPIVASMATVAASGGLYVAASASRIYALPGTLTGSIGVLIQIPNVSDIAGKIGFQMETIKSGKLKDVGNSFRDLTEDERAFLQDRADENHRVFMQDIADARNLKLDFVQSFADGRVILGSEAKELGLIDEIGSLYDAARAVHELAGEPLDPESIPSLIYPDKRFQEFREIFEALIPFRMRSVSTMQVLYLAE